jgi:excisionase family DNA binding protein
MDAKPCLNSTANPLLNPLQAAEMLGINHHTLERMAKNKCVPAIEIGRLWRFRQSDLDAWIDSKVTVKTTKADR